LLKISGPFTAKKVSLLSVAMAFAIMVLQHPGGPYNRIPCVSNKKHYLRRFYAHSNKSFRVSERPFNHFAYLVFNIWVSPNIFPE
jgi:hypothetical protein